MTRSSVAETIGKGGVRCAKDRRTTSQDTAPRYPMPSMPKTVHTRCSFATTPTTSLAHADLRSMSCGRGEDATCEVPSPVSKTSGNLLPVKEQAWTGDGNSATETVGLVHMAKTGASQRSVLM